MWIQLGLRPDSNRLLLLNKGKYASTSWNAGGDHPPPSRSQLSYSVIYTGFLVETEENGCMARARLSPDSNRPILIFHSTGSIDWPFLSSTPLHWVDVSPAISGTRIKKNEVTSKTKIQAWFEQASPAKPTANCMKCRCGPSTTEPFPA
jgi:hypothetical protein